MKRGDGYPTPAITRGEMPKVPAGPAPGTPTRTPMIRHYFPLRPGLRVMLDLPDDLTTSEAERLVGMIRALAFGVAEPDPDIWVTTENVNRAKETA